MMKHEFEELAGYMVSDSDYINIIEPMYMATDLSKAEFVSTIDKKRFEMKPQKSAERLSLEEKLSNELEDCKHAIELTRESIELYSQYIDDEDGIYWKNEVKRLRRELSLYKEEIKRIKWVLA